MCEVLYCDQLGPSFMQEFCILWLSIDWVTKEVRMLVYTSVWKTLGTGNFHFMSQKLV
jgi:hypothetical protein